MNIADDSLLRLRVDATNELASFNYYNRIADMQTDESNYQTAKLLADQAYESYRKKEDQYWSVRYCYSRL